MKWLPDIYIYIYIVESFKTSKINKMSCRVLLAFYAELLRADLPPLGIIRVKYGIYFQGTHLVRKGVR